MSKGIKVGQLNVQDILSKFNKDFVPSSQKDIDYNNFKNEIESLISDVNNKILNINEIKEVLTKVFEKADVAYTDVINENSDSSSEEITQNNLAKKILELNEKLDGLLKKYNELNNLLKTMNAIDLSEIESHITELRNIYNATVNEKEKYEVAITECDQNIDYLDNYQDRAIEIVGSIKINNSEKAELKKYFLKASLPANKWVAFNSKNACYKSQPIVIAGLRPNDVPQFILDIGYQLNRSGMLNITTKAQEATKMTSLSNFNPAFLAFKSIFDWKISTDKNGNTTLVAYSTTKPSVNIPIGMLFNRIEISKK